MKETKSDKYEDYSPVNKSGAQDYYNDDIRAMFGVCVWSLSLSLLFRVEDPLSASC
jgi:hypothetical protein